MSVERNFKGVWIPSDIWLARDLSLAEKVMLVEIDSLQHEERGCYASNAHFAEFFDLSKSRVSEIISGLVKKGLLVVTQIREGRQVVERQLRVVHRAPPPPSEKAANPLRKKRRTPSEKAANPIGKGGEPPSENTEGSNTSINNTENNTGEGLSNEAGATLEGELMPAAVPPMIVPGKDGVTFEIPGDLRYPKKESKTHKTWVGYAIRYHQRYKAWPVWNAKIGGQVGKLIDRLGAEVAPAVAWFYLGVNESMAVKKMHSFDYLLSNAETFHTQYKTGRSVTSAEAAQADKSQTNYNAADEAKALLRARREQNKQ